MESNNPGPADRRTLVKRALDGSYSYEGYRELVAGHASAGTTTGANTSEAYIHYTRLNHRRMKRWDKQFALPETTARWLARGVRPQLWLVLTESWCGDAAPVLPVLHAFASSSPNIELRIALRDQHAELMGLHRTEGALAIPKLLVLDPVTLQVLASWGPRPAVLMRMVSKYKEQHGTLSAEMRESMQQWYNRDKGQALLSELVALLTLEKIGDGAFLGGTIRFAETGS